MIGIQGVALCRVLSRLEIGKDIRPAERINCLFGISHHEDRLLTIAIDGLEDLILHRVGILKFIK